MTEKTKVFAARYCSCTHESSFVVLSLHASRESAQKTVDSHKEKQRAEYVRIMDDQWRNRFPWSDESGDGSQAWDVHEYEVEP